MEVFIPPNQMLRGFYIPKQNFKGFYRSTFAKQYPYFGQIFRLADKQLNHYLFSFNFENKSRLFNLETQVFESKQWYFFSITLKAGNQYPQMKFLYVFIPPNDFFITFLYPQTKTQYVFWKISTWNTPICTCCETLDVIIISVNSRLVKLSSMLFYLPQMLVCLSTFLGGCHAWLN